jgi:hypothetical protein
MWYTEHGWAGPKVLEQDEETQFEASLFFCLGFEPERGDRTSDPKNGDAVFISWK